MHTTGMDAINLEDKPPRTETMGNMALGCVALATTLAWPAPMWQWKISGMQLDVWATQR